MNQKIIWIIIGLLAASLIGVMSLQIKFIMDNYAEQEMRFDQHVNTALKRVAYNIENNENLQQMLNGFNINQYQQMSNGYSESSTTIISSDPSLKLAAGQFLKGLLNKPIEDRIELPKLVSLLKQELGELKTPFNYGVYSFKDSSFVIYNNQYIIPNENQAAIQNLKYSEYKTILFYDGVSAPGALMLTFPSKSRVVWGNLGNILILSLLFATVILGCFGYTINVIFKQKKLSEMKNDFINNMTHEFKTPIATISLAADSITNSTIISNPDKIKRFADIIKQENKRMNGQVEKVLQMALIERETLKLNLTSIDMHEVIQQALGNISLQVEKKDGSVSSNLKAEKHMIEGDLNHISNLINNLLDNANKYSPEKPDITVSTRNVSNGIEITVADKGIGMSKEAKKRIFEKFYRVHTGNLHDVKGFGLGLAYVKAMVTAHNGSIDVKSELGKGSSFIVFLPFHSPQAVMN